MQENLDQACDAGRREESTPDFDAILKAARVSLPFVNPRSEEDSRLGGRMELQRLAILAIADFWGYFVSAQGGGNEAPALGSVHGERGFQRTFESFAQEFEHYDSAYLLERLQGYMLQALSSVLDVWIERQERRLRRGEGEAAPELQVYSRLRTLLQYGTARRAQDPRAFMLPGMHTALGSMMSCIATIPPLFRGTFGRDIDRATFSEIIGDLMLLHSRLARTSFDFFVVFVNFAGEPQRGFPLTFKPEHFALEKVKDRYQLKPKPDFLKVLESVVQTQRIAGQDAEGIKEITGCPALYAAGAMGEGQTQGVIKEFQGWINNLLETFYLPRFGERKAL